VLELGGYCGYSAVRIASQLGTDAKLISVDPSEYANNIARQLVEHAGLTHKVEFVVQTSTVAIPAIKTRFGIEKLDLIFIDHIKDMYLTDLKLMETSGVIASGTVLVADNVIYPGAPDYLEYVRSSPLYTSVYHDSLLEYTHDQRDGVEVSIRK
jgi:catechol O-methyltransferase